MAGAGIMILFLVGLANAGGASYCNISNVTIAAMCSNITSQQTQINLTSANQIRNSSIQGNAIASLRYNQSQLTANQIKLQNMLNNNVTTISGLSATIAKINSTANNANANATIAKANASQAKAIAYNSLNKSTDVLTAINNFNSSLNQKTGLLNSNITLINRELSPYFLLNLTGGVRNSSNVDYAKTSSNAQNAGWEGGLALILVILLIILEAVRIILGMRKPKIPPEARADPIMGAESKAKASKEITDTANAKALAELQARQANSDEEAKMDKLKADPRYKPFVEQVNKDRIKAKKKGMPPIESWPSYKALQDLAMEYKLDIIGGKGSANGK